MTAETNVSIIVCLHFTIILTPRYILCGPKYQWCKILVVYYKTPKSSKICCSVLEARGDKAGCRHSFVTNTPCTHCTTVGYISMHCTCTIVGYISKVVQFDRGGPAAHHLFRAQPPPPCSYHSSISITSKAGAPQHRSFALTMIE